MRIGKRHVTTPLAAVMTGLAALAVAQAPAGPPPSPPAGPPGLAAPRQLPLVECDGSARVCVKVKPELADIVGVWKGYFGNPMIPAPDGMSFLRYSTAGEFIVADAPENTDAPFPPYPHGTISLEDGVLTLRQDREDVLGPCRIGRYEVSVYYYGTEPVALVHRLVEDDCPGRHLDMSSPRVWVSE